MSLKENNQEMKKIQNLIEERVKYFLKYQPQTQNNKKEKDLKFIQKYDNYSTLIDPINIKNDNLNPIFINNINLTQNINNTNINNIINNISQNQIIKNENINDSTLFTQKINNSEIPLKKSIAIPVNKEIAKYMKQRFERKIFYKINPKFSITNADNNSILNKQKSSNHKYTKSEIEILETDEKVPQIKISEILGDNQKENISDSKFEDNNLLKMFHSLINIEKCYQELSKDLKGNGLKNIEYKLKIGCNYLNLITDEKYLISEFHYDEDDINIFLIRELCFYLIFLFLDNYINELDENNIKELQTCLNYCHINFIYLIMITIKKFEKDISENKFKLEENTIDFSYFQNCKMIIEINSNKINIRKCKENFHINNKIIKNILLNIINNFGELNKDITENILGIYNLSKKSKYKTILNENIRNNFLINEKINIIIKKLNSPENNEENQQNDNIIKKDITIPYLPPKKKDDKRDYCLVLDLDETLVHFFEDNSDAYVKVRMCTEQFITVLSQYCEIVIFTASTQNYADIVIDGLDCKNLIDYKLYREHTIEYNGINVKDLSKLGRDLNKVIIIDNIEDNYCLQPNNGLNIIDFEGDENDNELQFLLEDLLEVVAVPGKNVINELPHIRKNMQKRYCDID